MPSGFRDGQAIVGAFEGNAYQPAAGSPLQDHASYYDGQVVIPTLRVNQQANPNDRSTYSPGMNLVSIFQEAAPATVRIEGQRQAVDQGQQVTQDVTGSGFFVTASGDIATDYHVVRGLNGITVTTADGRRYSATVEAVDQAKDLAVLRVNAAPYEQFPVLPLGGGTPAPGSNVWALGYPRGWQNMFISPGTTNMTQPLRNVLRAGNLGPGEDPNRTVLDTSIHVEPGNSGGPLVGADGRVYGLVSTTDAGAVNSAGVVSPGNDAEMTPVQDLINLLNRSGIRPDYSRIATAGSLPMPGGNPEPYYAPAAPSGWLNAGGALPPSLEGITPQSLMPRATFFGGSSAILLEGNRPPAPAEPAPPPVGQMPVHGESLNIPLPAHQAPSLIHTLANGVNLYRGYRAVIGGQAGPAGSLFSVALGGIDLIRHDAGSFRKALAHHSGKELLSAGLSVGADTLLIGGGIASLTPTYRALGAVASLAGSGIKLAGDGYGYYRYFR